MINSYVKEMIVAAIVIGVLAAIALMMQGCTHDGCTPEETRCDGNVVQLCDSDEDWNDVMDCVALRNYPGEDYVCCWDNLYLSHNCLSFYYCGEEQ